MQVTPLDHIKLARDTFVRSVVGSDYEPLSVQCIENATRKLLVADGHPVMLLGKVQSGKTRTFLGIIAYCFDNGFDISVILTKGTRALAQQTLKRLQSTFADLDDEDEIRIYDIMQVPANLPARDRRRKILLVVKKEDDNLNRLSDFLFNKYPDLAAKRVLIIDDEADLASVGFRGNRRTGVRLATIAGMIESLRKRLNNSALLQVTATPYALYLQPQAEYGEDNNFIYQPLRPAYTEIVPIHDRYIGGETYFIRSEQPDSVESYMHVEVMPLEFDALKRSDGRRLKLENVLTSSNCLALRTALLDFVVGASIRRLQQQMAGHRKTRFSMVVHTEQSRESHQWQMQVTERVVNEYIDLATADDGRWNSLVEQSIARLAPALTSAGNPMPRADTVVVTTIDLIEGVRVQRVNSDEDVLAMLGDNGQLRLESVLTVFIGGQILDRGVTIEGLIAFYYGRNPQVFQQDTVLQHSRMYGARPIDDLPVTRFYTSDRLRKVMSRIHEFDHALRIALEPGNDQGVAFIQEERGRIKPCAPNKLMLSQLTSITPGRRLLPIGFQTKAPSYIRTKIARLDAKVSQIAQATGDPVLADLEDVIDAITDALLLLDLEHRECVFDERAFLAAVSYLSKQSAEPLLKGNVLVLVRDGRHARRQFENGRLSNIPYSATDAELANNSAINVPCIMLLRQDGTSAMGWRDAPFYWPVLQAPVNMRPVVFSAEVLADEGSTR